MDNFVPVILGHVTFCAICSRLHCPGRTPECFRIALARYEAVAKPRPDTGQVARLARPAAPVTRVVHVPDAYRRVEVLIRSGLSRSEAWRTVRGGDIYRAPVV